MTLGRQLFLSGIMVLSLLFFGITGFVVHNAKIFFSAQLESHAQDTATALGLTLSNTMKQNDVVTASRMIDAIWDRGDFLLIRVQTAKGEVVIEQKASLGEIQVPYWFLRLVSMEPQRKEALIMDGWHQFGKVIVVSDPRFAYRGIWLTFLQSLEWLFFIMMIALILGSVLLHMILKPLHAITNQAIAICNKEFPIQTKLPRTRDLRKLVEAMNNMSGRLKKLFEEEAAVFADLRDQTYRDPVTQLMNRRFFDQQIDTLLQDFDNGVEGVLLLLEIVDLKKINQKFGYQAGDKLLIAVAEVIQGSCKDIDNAVIAHSRGANFFILLPRKTKLAGESIANAICEDLKKLEEEGKSPTMNVGHIGMTIFRPGETKKEVISRADMALRIAQSKGENAWYSEDLKPHEIHTATEWITVFERAIEKNKIVLFFQDIVFSEEKRGGFEKYGEILSKIQTNEDNIIPASVFVPIAEQLNLMTIFDQQVIQNIVEHIQQEHNKTVFFANISMSALENREFQVWIIEKFRSLGKRANQLVIELSENSVVRHLEYARGFFKEISELGGRICIDQYGNSFSSFSYLYNLKINYLKIDPGFIRSLETDESKQFFIRSLAEIAHSLDIFVLAGMVETEAQYQMLRQLGVDGLQGYFISEPHNLDK